MTYWFIKVKDFFDFKNEHFIIFFLLVMYCILSECNSHF